MFYVYDTHEIYHMLTVLPYQSYTIYNFWDIYYLNRKGDEIYLSSVCSILSSLIYFLYYFFVMSIINNYLNFSFRLFYILSMCMEDCEVMKFPMIMHYNLSATIHHIKKKEGEII